MPGYHINEKQLTVASIPCRLVEPETAGAGTPLVLHYHGWHSRKEDQRFLASLLAQRGYRVLLPDADKHGDRGPIDYDAPVALRENFWPIVLRTVEEAHDLLAAAERELGVTPERIAVTGISMGGFIASGIFAEHERLATVININGGLAWEHAELVFRGEDGSGLATDRVMAAITAGDPLRRREAFYPRPILMLHGTADQVISIEIQRHAERQIRPLYAAQPERFELFEDPRANHSVTLSMVERAFAWLGEYLPAESD